MPWTTRGRRVVAPVVVAEGNAELLLAMTAGSTEVPLAVPTEEAGERLVRGASDVDVPLVVLTGGGEVSLSLARMVENVEVPLTKAAEPCWPCVLGTKAGAMALNGFTAGVAVLAQ